MKERIAARILAEHYQLIKQLSSDEQGRVIIALLDAAFAKFKNQNEIQNENQIEFSALAKSILQAIMPAVKVSANRAGGARAGAGRPRKSGNVPKMHMSENIVQLDNSKNQNEIQIDFFEKESKNQNEFFEKTSANARASDNINNNNINNYPEKETYPLSGISKEKAPYAKWGKFLDEWNRIATLYQRPKCRTITPAMQKMISARCKENKLHLSDFLIICEKALAGDKSLRCGTDSWGGADLIYFARTANFTRALQIADNPAIQNNQGNATVQVLRDFIKGGK